jgi:hypothetical protein
MMIVKCLKYSTAHGTMITLALASSGDAKSNRIVLTCCHIALGSLGDVTAILTYIISPVKAKASIANVAVPGVFAANFVRVKTLECLPRQVFQA